MTSMTNEERMQRESNLIATIRKTLLDFAKMCADDDPNGGYSVRTRSD
jgi:hypothetical protein